MASTACLLVCLFSSLLSTSWAEGATDNLLVLPRSPCPPGVLYYNRFCYEVIDEHSSWENAELECQFRVEDAHLASILSPAEGRMVSAYAKRKTSDNHIWIGLHAERKASKLTWAWSDYSPYISGSPLWDDQRPSTNDNSGECIALINIQHPTAASKWEQRSCLEDYPYICKFKASS